MPEPASENPQDPLVSELAASEDMLDLVEFFLHDLPGLVDGLGEAVVARDLGRLRDIARELKESAGGYGFPGITRCAARLERALLADEADLSAVGERVEDLIALCRRATT